MFINIYTYLCMKNFFVGLLCTYSVYNNMCRISAYISEDIFYIHSDKCLNSN